MGVTNINYNVLQQGGHALMRNYDSLQRTRDLLNQQTNELLQSYKSRGADTLRARKEDLIQWITKFMEAVYKLAEHLYTVCRQHQQGDNTATNQFGAI